MSKRIYNVFKEITKMLFLYKKTKIRDILFIDMKGLKIEW